jgi:glycosyltransferase involved in cell wall biosynthesis
MQELIKMYLPPKLVGLIKWMYSAYRLGLARKYGVLNYVSKNRNKISRILFYDINGLSYAGTQKFIQILAKYLNKDKYDVFLMYASKNHNERREYLENSGVKLIDFDFRDVGKKLPYYVFDMKPHIFDVIRDNQIDLMIVAGSGYPEFPVANITKLPVIFLNVFGSVDIQKNIRKHVCMSNLLANIINKCIPNNKIEVLYIPSEGPDSNSAELGRELRLKMGFTDSDVVFGRIGRPDDNIFDAIGINAFKKIVKDYPNAHYLVVSPPPMLCQIVKDEDISNVHFLPPISDEKDIWAFHNAIDVLAHFRKDGETCGLNIAESMLCGKPIISHKSFMWNAHLEYLDNSFSRIAEIDDCDQYAEFMKEFIEFKKNGKLLEMGRKAKEKGDELFLIKNNIGKFENWIDEVLRS